MVHILYTVFILFFKKAQICHVPKSVYKNKTLVCIIHLYATVVNNEAE